MAWCYDLCDYACGGWGVCRPCVQLPIAGKDHKDKVKPVFIMYRVWLSKQVLIILLLLIIIHSHHHHFHPYHVSGMRLQTMLIIHHHHFHHVSHRHHHDHLHVSAMFLILTSKNTARTSLTTQPPTSPIQVTNKHNLTHD